MLFRFLILVLYDYEKVLIIIGRQSFAPTAKVIKRTLTGPIKGVYILKNKTTIDGKEIERIGDLGFLVDNPCMTVIDDEKIKGEEIQILLGTSNSFNLQYI